MKAYSKILFLVLTLFVLLLCSALTANASGTAEEKALIYQNPEGRIMSAVNKGDWHAFPENSIPAIQSAADKGSDIVRLDVKKTKDGILVLFADDTINRMCYPTPQTATYLTDLTFAELSEYTLRNRQGDALAENTSLQVPTLRQAMDSSESVLFLLDFDWSLRDEVYNEVKENEKLGSVIFLTRASAKKSMEWRTSLDESVMTMGYHKSNVVFLATNYVSNYVGNGEAVWLATNNPYGMNFQPVVTGRFENRGRAVASPATPELCGKKTDTVLWWNDLVSRGFSVIITDYPAELSEYIQNSHSAAEKLAALNDSLSISFHLPDLQADVFTQYKRSFEAAKGTADALLVKGFAGEQELNDAYYQLQRAVDDIERNITELRQGKTGLTVTPVRIFVAVLAIAAVTSAQIYTHKKMKKRNRTI